MSEYNNALVKKRKLDSDSFWFERLIRISHLLILPEEMITNIFSYVGTNVGEENPSDGENIVLNENLPDSTKEKFQLSMVCSRFNYLIKKPASWKRNNVLTIYPTGHSINVRMPSNILLNGIFFTGNKAAGALQKLLEVAEIKQIVVVNIIYWAINDDSKSLREGMLQCFRKNEEKLKRSVDKLTLHGFLTHKKTKDLVSWFCNAFPNLRSIDLTVPIHDTSSNSTLGLKFEETEIVNCPLEKVKLSRFENSPDLLKILDGKRVRELTINIQWHMENGTQTLIELSNKISDGTLQKLVIGPVALHTSVTFIRISQWLASTRPAVISNLRHLELDHIFVLDIGDLRSILTFLPSSLLYLKIHCDNSIIANRIQMFQFLTHVIMGFFETTTIEKAEFNFHTVNLFDENQFRKYRRCTHRQWEGISIEQRISEEDRLNYRFAKYGRCIDVTIT